MDFTDIDKLISQLEKKRSLKPGSPPVVLNGHLGIWRTIRHNRMFIELDADGNQGKVLVGPPSFVGRSLKNVPDDVWSNLTPRATLQEFRNVKVSEGGLENLKNSIENAVGPDDTRRDSIKNINSHLQLVPIARSAGFSDDEIKRALKGESVNSPIEPKDSAESSTKDTPKPSKPKKRVETKPKGSQAESAELGNLALAIQTFDDHKGASSKKAEELGEFLRKLSESGTLDDIMRKKLKQLGDGLISGDYKVSTVKNKLLDLKNNRDSVNTSRPSQAQLDALSDRAKMTQFLDSFDKKLNDVVEDKAKKLFSDRFKQSGGVNDLTLAQRESIQKDAVLKILGELLPLLESSKAKTEVKRIMESVRTNPFSKRSILLRLYQILQLLLLLVPLP